MLAAQKQQNALTVKRPAEFASDQYEIMRDENIQLKTRHKELEEQIKLIAVKLKR
jgi:hypothetical protein